MSTVYSGCFAVGCCQDEIRIYKKNRVVGYPDEIVEKGLVLKDLLLENVLDHAQPHEFLADVDGFGTQKLWGLDGVLDQPVDGGTPCKAVVKGAESVPIRPGKVALAESLDDVLHLHQRKALDNR